MMLTHVVVLMIDTGDHDYLSAHPTLEGAINEIHAHAVKNWESAGINTEIPEDQQDAIDVYFKHANREGASLEVIDLATSKMVHTDRIPKRVRKCHENDSEINCKVGAYNFEIYLAGGCVDGGWGGTITTNLKDDTAGDATYYTSIDAIESLVLAHACADIAVDDPMYIEGLESMLEALGNAS